MIKCLLVCGLSLASLTSYATTYQVEGSVAFTTTGTGGVNVKGDGAKLVGHAEDTADGKVTGTFTVKLADLDTGIKLRTEHMRQKYLQVATYPEAKLVLKNWKRSPTKSEFTGDLTVHGVTKPITGQASVSNEGHIDAEFTVTLEDFGITGVCYLGVCVAKTVTVDVDADIK